MRLARREHKVVRLRLLGHHPYTLDIIARYGAHQHAYIYNRNGRTDRAPIRAARRVSKIEGRLLALPVPDLRCGAVDLARDESPPPARALVVEEDVLARVHAVCLAVVDDDPVHVQLRAAVRRARVERRCLALRCLDDLAV